MLILGKVGAFLASKLGAWAIAAVLAAGVAGFAWYVWSDRERMQIEVAALEGQLGRQAEAHAAAIEGWAVALDLERLRAERARQTAARRAEDLAALSGELQHLAVLEAADTGGEHACPLHPAVVWAIDRVRGDAGAP